VETSPVWQPTDTDIQGDNRMDSVSSEAEQESDDSNQDSIPDFLPHIEIGAEIDENLPALGGEEGERIRKSVMQYGIDALGWYSTFHATGRQWGAYISTSGIAYMVGTAFAKLPVPIGTKIQLAFHAILNHELFHFAADYAIAQAELAHQESWYLPAKMEFVRIEPHYCEEEETLANAYMLRAFRTMKPPLAIKGKQEALRNFTLQQPDGYRNAYQIRKQDWSGALFSLGGAYCCRSGNGAKKEALWEYPSGYDWAPQFPILPKIDWRFCPIHLVNDGHRLGLPPEWLNLFSQLSKIHETDSFRGCLGSMHPSIQKAWERTKNRLEQYIPPGADFKKWAPGGPNIYSVRVNDSVRAHLEYRQPPGDWKALKIGTHKAMGHG
jgi:hypothetical protein